MNIEEQIKELVEKAAEEAARKVYMEERRKEEARASTLLDERERARIKQWQIISYKPYLTRKEAALYLDVSARSIQEWTLRPPDQNPFPEKRAGADARIKREQIDEWVERESMRRRLKAL